MIKKKVKYLIMLIILPFLSNASFEIGVGTHLDRYKYDSATYLKLLQQYGFTSFRDDYTWSKVEKVKNKYKVDRTLQQADFAFMNSKSYNVNGMVILAYGNMNYDFGKYPTSDEAIKGFANYASWTAKRFKGRVKYYEIWNEWIYGTGMPKSRNNIPSAENYYNLVKTTSIPVIRCSPTNLPEYVDKRTQFIVALETDQGGIRNAWLRYFMINGFRYVSVIPTLRGMPLDSTDMSFIFSHEVMIFRVHQNLAKLSSRVLKRTFDIVGSLSIICALSPLLAFIAYKVKSDKGPAIYGHERIGKNGKPFKCLKFRSMVINSKEVLEELLQSDPQAKAEWDATFKLKDDPRVTSIGKFLRKTSLDELPQLFNVLRGEMSLVGPRPIINAELERYSEEVDYYLLGKPGMTGLWQVSGRSDVDYETRVYLDAWYVKNWSMWNDIAILFKTIGVVVKKDGAY